MMKLSIVIVNYNVRHFLEQVLLSVQKAIGDLAVEVFVVDNNSVDNSVEMVERQFPWVHLIANKENLGFSKANNQAIRLATGEYVLLLNPDTVLQEDSLEKCCHFMDEHPDCGGLGVRMIDGKGKFLPESKRGLPTPAVAFYKMTGLSALFPKSKKFGRYHLKYLAENETHEIDVLSGAFMMLRSSVLEKVGLLDEAFFMYGEDIDLSYRITQSGMKNYYYPGTTIIHYKGESTKKKSANYVKVFYNAMVLFAQKHYSKRMAGWFAFFISTAVRLRAFIALVFRFLAAILSPALDFVFVYLGFYGIAWYWEVYNKYVHGFYPDAYYFIYIPIYILCIQLVVWLSGGYDKPLLPSRLLRGTITGAMLVFVVYAFLPKDMQFSRAILFLGCAWAVVALPLLRLLTAGIRTGKFNIAYDTSQRIVVVGGNTETHRIQSLIAQSQVRYEYLGFVSASSEKPTGYVGVLAQIKEIVEIFKINQIIFSATDVKASQIMETMSALSGMSVHFKIVPENSTIIIGSNSKNTLGELYTIDIRLALEDKRVRRNKRIFDIGFCLWTWLFSPVLVFMAKGRLLLKASPKIFVGKRTWVGYNRSHDASQLPVIGDSLVDAALGFEDEALVQNSHLAYAKDYSIQKDLTILIKYIFN
jgi:O-antigen biosynthesis protein